MAGPTPRLPKEAGEISPASSFERPPERSDAPLASMTIWPNRSMPRRGFKAILIFTAGMLCLPIIPLIGTPVGIALLPFLFGTLFLLWFFIEKNYREGDRLREVIELWPDLITVARFDPGQRVRYWSANPYWVRTEIHSNARLENYLTLKGSGRNSPLFSSASL